MVLLHEMDINYPPTNTLPKQVGPWGLCKRVQYPMKDADGNVVADEYRQPVFSSLFANAVVFIGKIATRTTWVTGQQSTSGAGRKVHSLSLMNYTDEDILQMIDEGNVFCYMNKDDEDAPPLTIDQYKQLNADSSKSVVNDVATHAQDTPSVQSGVTAG